MPIPPKSTDGLVASLLRFFRSLWAKESPGARGERIAARWLRREKGYTLIARNWRNPRDRREEIDLVCRDGDVLVFVEVKTRSVDALVPGYYAVDAHKKAVLRSAIGAYLRGLDTRWRPATWRCDVVEVALPTDPHQAPEVLHFENIALSRSRA